MNPNFVMSSMVSKIMPFTDAPIVGAKAAKDLILMPPQLYPFLLPGKFEYENENLEVKKSIR